MTDPSIDPLIPGGRALVDLVDAVLADASVGEEADRVSVELGMDALVDAAAVIGNFQMMNRVADATGIPVGKGSRIRNAELIAALGFRRFDHLPAE